MGWAHIPGALMISAHTPGNGILGSLQDSAFTPATHSCSLTPHLEHLTGISTRTLGTVVGDTGPSFQPLRPD